LINRVKWPTPCEVHRLGSMELEGAKRGNLGAFDEHGTFGWLYVRPPRLKIKRNQPLNPSNQAKFFVPPLSAIAGGKRNCAKTTK
jgi:hypothetical protein